MIQSFSLDGKVIVVTGGTGSLGKTFIECIAASGGTVGILGRNRAVAEERATRINKAGGKALALRADVTNKNDLVNARKILLNTYGKIDGLVNAAGSNMKEEMVKNEEDIFDMNMGDLRKIMDLNLWGTILPTQVFGEAISQGGGGSIINISSVAAKRAISRILGYSMAKASVECFTKWYALELGRRYRDGIRINAIVPGFFAAEHSKAKRSEFKNIAKKHPDPILQKVPFKRFGEPEELKGILIWLLSSASKFVTGTTISVDGGFNIDSGVVFD